MKVPLTLAQAIEFQRAEVDRDLRHLRRARLMQAMKLCPLCHPKLFDASLDATPTPLYCRRHAAHFLARVGITMHRHEDHTAQPCATEPELKQCA